MVVLSRGGKNSGFLSPCAETRATSAKAASGTAANRLIGSSLLRYRDPPGWTALGMDGVQAGGSLAGKDSSAALFTWSNLGARLGSTDPARHLRLASCDLYAIPTSAEPAAIIAIPIIPRARARECSES